MGTDLINVAGFKSGPNAAFASLNPNDESLSDGIGGSYGIINYKGKVWSLVYRGEKHTFVKDDGYPLEYLDVIILQQAKIKSKSYFPNWEEGSTAPPLCASVDGIVPDSGVPQPQADTCSLCPRNVWKTSEDGKKVRECQDYKRVAVLLMPAQTAKLLGAPLLEPVFLRIPGASLQGLALMGDEMKKRNYHFSTFITRVDFDPTQSYPKMRFKAIQELTEKEAPVVLPLRMDPLALRIIGEGQGQPAITHQPIVPPPQQQRVETGLVPSSPGPAAPSPAAAAPKPQPAKPPVVHSPPTQAQTPVQPPAPAQTAAAPTSPTAPAPAPIALVDTGFGGVTETPSPAISLVPEPGPTIDVPEQSDTGAPSDADAAMDARIAALMPK